MLSCKAYDICRCKIYDNKWHGRWENKWNFKINLVLIILGKLCTDSSGNLLQ